MAEKLEEISKKTLGRYIKRASTDNADRAGFTGIDTQYVAIKRGERNGPGRWDQYADEATMRKYQNRESGIHKAVNRLTKEDMEDEQEPTLEELLVEAYDDIIRGAIEDKPADVQDALRAVLDAKIVDRIDALRYSIPQNTFDAPSANTEYGDEGEEEWEDDGEWEVEDDDNDEIEVAEEEYEEDGDEADRPFEESEQLDEISKKTLSSYINHAHADRAGKWSRGSDEAEKISDYKKTYDQLGNVGFSGHGLDGEDSNHVYNIKGKIHQRINDLERKHNKKNRNRADGIKHAVNRLQGRFAGKTVYWDEPEKTPTGRDSKTKTVKKHQTVYKDYKGD